MIAQRYSIPGGLRFELETSDPAAASFFEAEYGWARGESEARFVLMLRWDRADWPSRRSSDERVHSHKMLARWAYKVKGGKGGLDYEIRGNRWALPMVHHMLVHQGLRFLAARRDVLFLHASAVERDGSSILLTGPGGAGKTTTSALVLARGDEEWRYHADDYVVVDAGNRRSFAYPTRAHVYADLTRTVPEITGRLGRTERLKVLLFSALRRWSGQRIKVPTRVELGRLWPRRELAEKATLGGVVLLNPSESEEVELHKIDDGEIPLDELIEMNFFEARHFIHLMEKAGFWAIHTGALENWRGSERRMLAELAERVPFWRLSIPASGRVAPDHRSLGDLLEQALTREKIHE